MTPHEDDILKRFGRRLRVLRKSAGYSQEDFALACDMDRSYVGAVERGERNLSLRNIEKISSELKITMSELFQGL